MIEQLTTTELKAMAYDHMAQIEKSNMMLNAINQEIAKRQTQELAAKKNETPQRTEKDE